MSWIFVREVDSLIVLGRWGSGIFFLFFFFFKWKMLLATLIATESCCKAGTEIYHFYLAVPDNK